MYSRTIRSLGRTLSAVTLSLALSVGYLTVEALPARAADTYEIWDEGLATCVAGSITGYSGDGYTFTAAELLTITSLSCAGLGIYDLTGLQGIQNATTVDLSNNAISDLTGAQYLFNVQSLNLSGNQLTDVSGARIDSLTTLNVSSNHIVSLQPLDGLSNLTSVTATDQTASWTIPVNEATAVPLVVRGTSLPQTLTPSDASLTIADGQATGTIAGTYTITFTDDQYGVNFTGVLTTLVDAGPVTVPDAAFAACLDDKLGVTGNVFSSVALGDITSLDCSNRGIADLTGASALRGATSLDFSHNEITAAAPLGANAALTSLNLSYNKIATINAVPTSNLTTINISHNLLADASPFAAYPQLTTLDASSQSVEVTVEAGTATDLAVRDFAGAAPTFTLPDGVTFDAGQVTAAAGIYSVPFSSADGAKTFSGTLTLSSHAEITIPDAHLAQCIAVAMDKTPSTTTFSNLDLAGIIGLSCANQTIVSLDGLQYLTNAAYLDLSYNQISDLSPLAGLTGLMDLRLTHNNISDASPLAGLTSVANLYLNENNLYSIADLAPLTGVTVLDVSNNHLTSLTGVAGKIWLYSLKASDNELTSLAPISALTRLKVLEVSNNQLTSLSVIEGYSSLAKAKMTTLAAAGNRLTVLPNLTGFTALSKLYVSNNKITSLAPLSGNVAKLSIADFANNQISSLNGIAGHPLLLSLDLSGNQITDVSALSGLTMLGSLHIYDNQLADLSPLSGLTSLTLINARDQHPVLAVYPTVATDLGVKDSAAASPTLGTLPDGVSVAGGLVTAGAEGTYAIPFTSGDYASTLIEFSGTLTVKATYNAFTTATPTITGTPTVDEVLTAHTGTWSPEPAFAYQWNADGSPIAGATEATYTVGAETVGKAITVTVTGTKDTYAATPVTSAATEPVAQATFTAPAKVTITGWYTFGETLTAAATWTPTPDSVSYTWLRDGVAIEGATGSTYTLTWDDVEHAISVQIAVTKAGYVGDSLTSAAKTVTDGVVFPDASLRSCVANATGISAIVYTNAQLSTVTSLDCTGYYITDLTGLENLNALTSLNLMGSTPADLAPVGALTELTSLNLEHTTTTSLEDLSQLSKLASLDVSDNSITSLAGVSGLTALTSLDLANNQITSLSALSTLSELTSLTATNNKISDATPLAGLSKLATIDLTAQQVTITVEAAAATAMPLKGIDGAAASLTTVPDGVAIADGAITAAAGLYFTNFTNAVVVEGDPVYFSGYLRIESHLDVSIIDGGFAACLADHLDLPTGTSTFSNISLADIHDLSCADRSIFSIDGAQYLTGAGMLDFADNSISDITPLAGLKTSLISLKLAGNDVDSIAALADHTALQQIYLSGNQVSDLTPLASVPDLRMVDVSSNRLTSLSGLGNQANLLSVLASGNALTSIAPLSMLTRVTTVDVSNNQLTSLSELSTSLAKTRLKTLTISGNRITSISTLSGFTKLATLRAANNKISDLTPLTNLTQLLEVDVTNNQVTSLAGLSNHNVLLTARLSGNQISDVTILGSLPLLGWVELQDNRIADVSPLAGVIARDGVVKATNQSVSLTAVPQVATAMGLADFAGEAPAPGVLPDGVSVDSGAVTAPAEGSYVVTFSAAEGTFTGTLTVTAAYNTFTTATPTISGTPKVASTLTAHAGTWTPEPTFAYQWKANGTDISGATDSTFVPTADERGKTISVTVTGTKDTYAAASLTSADTATVAAGTFAAPSQIGVSGTVAVGETVTADAGTWTPTPDSITYQWLRNGSSINGATNATYTLTTADAGKAISVQVIAAKTGYLDTVATSTATTAALGTMYGDKPVIVGTVAIGSTLQVGTGYWNPSPTFALQWYRAGYPIVGATGYEYVVTAADVGNAITVAQTGTVTGYAPLTKLSDPTNAVPSGSLSTSTGVNVDGTLAVGQTLTAVAGTWTPTPDSLGYQWLSDGEAIDGATSSTYLLGAADEGHVITVKVTAVKAGYTSASATSVDEGAVAAGSFIAATPSITGTATFGQTLHAAVDPWSPVANLSWQWLRDDSPISGATGTNYVLGAADVGAKISVKVTGSLTGYADTTTTSVQTDTVQSASFDAPDELTVNGDLAVGKTLSLDPATWTPTPDVTSYRWLRDGSAIDGATGATYTLTAADLGTVVTVEATATKAGYTSSTVVSAGGDPVAQNAFTTDVPVISGSPVVGQTLTATSGGWNPTPTTLSYQWQADGTDIADATQATFVVTPAQRDMAITVTVTGERAGYADATVTSEATAKVAAAELSGSTSVTVSGDVVVGSTLTASDVSWTPTPDAVVVQWLRSGVAIDGATAQTYTLTPADNGKVVTVSVTATKDGYRTVVLHSVAADPVAAATFTADTPVITGSPVVDQTLSADFGNWAPIPSAAAVQWKRDGKVVDGADSDTYLVTSADVGAKITVSLLGSRDGYADHTATSAATDTVTEASFVAPDSVTTSGTMRVGEFVTAQAGTWAPTPEGLSYQWLRDGEAIEGATSTASYLLTTADAGHVVTVMVTATKAGYTTTSLASAGDDPVAAGVFTAPTPTISGTATVDQTLTASTSPWTPSPSAISYQWLADGTPISGATGLTYTLSAADLGKTITFAVTGTKAGYTEATATSAASAAVAAASLSAPATVSVTGDLMVGATLTAAHGTWAPTPDSYSYRWLRDGSAIEAATSSTYTLTAADLGTIITAEVTATKAGYASQSLVSAEGDAVVVGQFQTLSPWISGNALVGSTLTAEVGYWSPEPSEYSYQWNANGDPIPGAEGNTFTVTQAQAGQVISLSVTGTRDGYQTVTINTGGTDAVPEAEFTAPSEINVTGDYVVGSTLTADAGTWTPAPTTLSYQWMRGSSAITDATGSTYVLTPADKGKVITVKVTATSSGYRTTTLRSVAADAVAPATFIAGTPTITGTAAIGQTLTAQVGTWSPVPSETTLQWKRDGKVIDGATGTTYTVTLDDANAKLSVEVSGTKDGYADASASSAETETVAAGQFTAPEKATVSGDRVVGETLTADAGTWSPTPTLAYRWLRDGAPIASADHATYTVTAADVDADITVEVTGSAHGYADLTISSDGATVVTKGVILAAQPVILGQAQVGRTLTAKAEGWTPTPTSFSYQWYLNGEAIDGATEATWTILESQVGATLTVTVTGTRDGYQSTAAIESDPVEVSAAGHFASPDEISVSGSYAVGRVLTAAVGTWNPAPVTVSYQWLRSGTPIDGATEAAYLLTAADVDKVITVKVTGAKPGFVTTAVRSSAPAAVAKGSFTTATPTLTGVPQIGQTLRVNPGTWTPSVTTVTYQWYRSGVAISGATGSSYTVVAADVWKTITVNVTGSRPGYATATRSVSATPVPQGVLAGVNPRISGKAKVKKTLKVVVGTWSPSPDKITYQWYRNGKVIKKATKAKYKLTKSDRGKRITVKVTVSKAGYGTRALTSAKTAKVKR